MAAPPPHTHTHTHTTATTTTITHIHTPPPPPPPPSPLCTARHHTTKEPIFFLQMSTAQRESNQKRRDGMLPNIKGADKGDNQDAKVTINAMSKGPVSQARQASRALVGMHMFRIALLAYISGLTSLITAASISSIPFAQLA